MILEGFEIENWSCIKRVAVDGLPATGVVVLHGPNGTGKSSIIAALRACLMDYPAGSTAKDLRRFFPKNSSEKPRVSVTFKVRGISWRIIKQFGTKESKLECLTAGGAWKLEKSTAADAHDETRLLLGGKDSNKGLHQLLWLTQAEFHLPEAKEFDTDVQSQLRGVLGVLQTPLDDRFLARVKQERSRWFAARARAGEKAKLKSDCSLSKALLDLAKKRQEMAVLEAEFQTFERLMEKSTGLEAQARDLQRELTKSVDVRDQAQLEYERSLKRLAAHQAAIERVAGAEKTLREAIDLEQRRDKLESRYRAENSATQAAELDAQEKSGRLQEAERALRELRRELQTLQLAGRQLQVRRDNIQRRLDRLALARKVGVAQNQLQRAEQTAGELEALIQQARTNPAPDPATFDKLDGNRTKAAKLRSDLDAAAIGLRIIREPNALPPRLAIDGWASKQAEAGTCERSVRRRADIVVPGWGRIEISRGSDARSLDEIEAALGECDGAFAELLAPFGLSAADPAALERLRSLAAEKKMRDPEIKRKKEQLGLLAPHGLDPLRQEIVRLENQLLASTPEATTVPGDLPDTASALESLAANVLAEIQANDLAIQGLQEQLAGIEGQIDGEPVSGSSGAKAKAGLRQLESDARVSMATLRATAKSLQDQLERMLTAAQIAQEIREAGALLAQAQKELTDARLTEDEETIGARLDAAKDSMSAIEKLFNDTQKDLRELKGEMRNSEGLHQRRAAADARVQELTQRTERERLESEAYDRLFALFEECREKQFDTVLAPIHDRVLRWMRLLRIGSYQSIAFSNHFLPEKLIGRDGATELAFDEESTGTIEQLALMVRLALGSTLASADEPMAAVLDDPLTHSDRGRLDLMRAVLKNAAAGEPDATPAAGPLQILVFTCHPEWFAVDGAKLVDLGKPELLSRCSP